METRVTRKMRWVKVLAINMITSSFNMTKMGYFFLVWLFTLWYEEGYDVYDEECHQWLTINHPDSIREKSISQTLETSFADLFSFISPCDPLTMFDSSLSSFHNSGSVPSTSATHTLDNELSAHTAIHTAATPTSSSLTHSTILNSPGSEPSAHTCLSTHTPGSDHTPGSGPSTHTPGSACSDPFTRTHGSGCSAHTPGSGSSAHTPGSTGHQSSAHTHGSDPSTSTLSSGLSTHTTGSNPSTHTPSSSSSGVSPHTTGSGEVHL